jgi:hypothetical protein
MSNKFELIDGKHPKVLVIDYYDNLVSDVDIYAEELLKKTKDDEYFDLDDYVDDDDDDEGMPDFSKYFYQPIEKQFEDTAIVKYKFDEDHELFMKDKEKRVKVKDFVHSQRMKAIEVIKAVQKQQIEHLNAAKKKPKTLEEALFTNKFCFLINLEKIKRIEMPIYKLLTFIVDFYLDDKTIKQIK